MSLPDDLSRLAKADAYPHDCDSIEVLETHISWVVLTGRFAYKLKKPVKFTFVDFSTLERRAHFCAEELRCNRRFAPSLYLDVVPVLRGPEGVAVGAPGDPGEVVEWAVKMRQFPPEAQLDRLLDAGRLGIDMLSRFGATLAAQHRALPSIRCGVEELDERVLAPVRDNYHDVAGLDWAAGYAALLERSRSGAEDQAARHRGLLRRRLAGGWIRECHGDLHLSNLVLLDDGVKAFDCLEFNPELRWIDPMSDVAFLFMDCLVRGRHDLAYAFLDGYLDASGDYAGVTLLAFYAAYRSMVRAKVAALRRDQTEPAQREDVEARFRRHLQWSARWLGRPAGRLILMCGLSGSGKSYLARRLAPRLPAVRLRSDVARKSLAGVGIRDAADADVDSGLYDPANTGAVYDWLAELCADLLVSGDHVVVDATFIDADRRQAFLALAGRLGTRAVIVHCDAPPAVLEQRVRERAERGGDPSDAGPEVLRRQQERFVPPERHAIRVDTGAELDDAALERLARRLAGR